MTIFTDGFRLESPERPVTDFTASFGAQQAAIAAQSWADSPTSQLAGIAELDRAKGVDYSRFSGVDDAATFGGQPAPEPAAPLSIDRSTALERVKQAGVERRLTLPEQDTIALPALDIMIRRARESAEREATIAAGPQNVFAAAAGIGTSFLVGAVDPLNIASSFIPVMGELRYGKLLASAGESAIARAGTRAGVGAAQGVVGQAALEPLDWYAHTQEGRDFGMADVLHNLVFGAALGGGLHAAGGAVGDIVRRRRGQALYPFGPGEPLEGVSGIHVPAQLLGDDGVPSHELGQLLGNIDDILKAPSTPPALRTLQDLPPRAQEDSMRAAIAAIVEGEPVKVGEMLEAAAKSDPRIAESFEAFHGTPHDFERFDSSKLGTGEGAQVFGHGLYFAENEKVADRYRRTVSDKAFVNKVAEIYDEGFAPDDAWAELKDNWDSFTPGEQRLLTALHADDWLGFDYPHQAVSAALRDLKGFPDVSPDTVDAVKAMGQMYQVRITANRDHFLDWDKPLHEQSEHVKAALIKLGFDVGKPETAAELAEKGLLDSSFQGRSGEVAYNEIAQQLATHKKGTPDKNGFYRMDDGRSAASRALADAGVPGIKYLDQGSRGAGEGTRNFVVFNDRHVEITHRNGAPVAQADLPPRLHALSAEARNWPELPQGASISGHGNNGPIVNGLEGRWGETLDWLRQAQTGDATAVLMHPEVPGKIDIIWGDKKHGLAHIDAEHPGEADRLPQFWADLRERPGSRGRYITLESDQARAVIAMDYRGDPKHWLLTYFELKREGGAETPPSGSPGGQAGLRPAQDLRSQPSGYYSSEGAGPGGNIGPAQAVRNGADGWNTLARRSTEADQPDVLAASSQAEAMPEPVKTKLDDRVAAAEKADAESAELYKMVSESLPETERQRLDDALKALDDDAKLQSEIIERSGACLFGARA